MSAHYRADGRHVHTAAFKQQFRALWEQTEPQLSCIEIGVVLGISKAAVTGLRQRLELAPRGSPIGRKGKDGERRRSAARTLRDEREQAMTERPAHLMPRPLVRPTAHFSSCQYPLSSSRPWRFCEAPLSEGEAVYCAEHRGHCYQATVPKLSEWRRYP